MGGYLGFDLVESSALGKYLRINEGIVSDSGQLWKIKWTQLSINHLIYYGLLFVKPPVQVPRFDILIL